MKIGQVGHLQTYFLMCHTTGIFNSLLRYSIKIHIIDHEVGIKNQSGSPKTIGGLEALGAVTQIIEKRCIISRDRNLQSQN